jgi:hypothetical protein
MEKKYYSLIDEEINEQEVKEGVEDFQIGYYENDRLLKKEIFVANGLSHVVYFMGDRSRESIVEEHLRHYTSVKFSILLPTENAVSKTLFFDENGTFISQQVSFAENDNIYVDERYDASGKLTGGTKYLKEGEDFILALEFDGEKQYYNGFDFGTGDSIPVAEALPLFQTAAK